PLYLFFFHDTPPTHTYTLSLHDALPILHQTQARLQTIEGVVPSPFDMPTGCRFHPRCQYAKPACAEGQPPLIDVGPHHAVACIKDRKSTRLNSSHVKISYAVFCLKKKIR